jgi:6-phosphogluconolactonase (cycloisomerase 2 family)
MLAKHSLRLFACGVFCCLTPMALAQSLSFTPGSLTFLVQTIGTTSAGKTVTLKNTSGTTALAITSITASGDYVTSSCPSSIPPGGSCVLTINFAPNAIGTINGAVTVVDNANPNTQVVSLTGTAVGPVTFAPASLSFPSTPIGTTSAAKTLTLTNLQAGSLTFTSVSTSGGYAISNNTCTGSIAANGTCTISVTFTPTVKGTISGSVTVKDSAADSPEVVNLSGSGTGTVTNPVSFSPASLTFSNQLTGSTSAGKTITLTNKGAAGLMVTGVTASGDYGETDTCTGQTIAQNGTCTITVKFTPSTTGTIKGEISVADSAATSQQVVNLTGTGVGTLSFSPATLAFNIQDLNVAGTPLSATLTNNSTTTVNITSIVVSGMYTAPSTCGASIAAHANCTFSVTFNPNSTGGINGAVTVADSATNSPQVLSLTATSTNPPRYAFVLHDDGTLAVFSVNPTTGQLRGNGYSFNNGAGFGQGQGITPSGKFYYTASNGVGVYGFSVTAAGGITPVPGSPFAANLGGCSPSDVVIDPTNKLLYFSDVCTGIWAFTIGSNGALTSVAGSPFGPGSNRYSTLTISPSGKFLYNPRSDVGIYAYTINSTTGALTQVAGSPFDPTFGTLNLIVSPSGKFAYVSPEVGSSVAAFSINSSTGVLTEIAGSPFAANAGVGPLAIDPGGKFLYAATSGPGNSGAGLDALSVNTTTGALTALPGNPFVTSISSTAVSIDPTGRFLFAVDINGNKAYTLSANPGTGALALLAAVRTNELPLAILSNTGAMPVTYTPKFSYATNQADKSISEYTVNTSTGALTAVSGSPLADANGPQAVSATPNQKFVYTANSNSSVSGYSVNTTSGALTKLTSSPFTGNSNHPVAIGVEPTGNFLYTVNNGDNSVSGFSIATNGKLTFFATLSTGTNPQGMAMDPLGRYVYVTNTTDNALSGYSIINGTLSPLSLSTSATGTTPMGATIDPSGQFLYVANSGDNTVSAYSISFFENFQGGDLAAVTGSPFAAGNAPAAVVAEPSGKFLYVANSGGSSISAYSINNSTGVLTPITGTFTTGSSPDSLSVSNDGKFLMPPTRVRARFRFLQSMRTAH